MARKPILSRPARIALAVTGGLVVAGGGSLAAYYFTHLCQVPPKKTGYKLETAYMDMPGQLMTLQQIQALRDGDRAMAAFVYYRKASGGQLGFDKHQLEKGETLVLLPVEVRKGWFWTSCIFRTPGLGGKMRPWGDLGENRHHYYGWLFPADFRGPLPRDKFWGLSYVRDKPKSAGEGSGTEVPG